MSSNVAKKIKPAVPDSDNEEELATSNMSSQVAKKIKQSVEDSDKEDEIATADLVLQR